jgi:hypothetical protein
VDIPGCVACLRVPISNVTEIFFKKSLYTLSPIRLMPRFSAYAEDQEIHSQAI